MRENSTLVLRKFKIYVGDQSMAADYADFPHFRILLSPAISGFLHPDFYATVCLDSHSGSS